MPWQFRRALPLLGATVLLSSAAPAFAQRELSYYVQPALRDITATADVIKKDDRELEKISKGLVEAYSLEKQQLQAKEPGMVRLEGKKGVFVIRYITNGTVRLTEVPSLRIRKAEDVTKEPSKADTLADIGVITNSFLGLVNSRWLRSETRDGKNLQVFELSFKQDPRYRTTVWMDPATRTMVEQQAHHRNRNRPGWKKRLVYSEVKQFQGVWLPTRVSLYNDENKLAGEVRYDGIRLNTGLSDSLFKVN